ncbi:mitochondrial carrier domain-containing protein [Protomyces lactucae-debilis]|uniref:Mitochondrial carrier domain-containing protein n=1 Tax=Protomyces lactucae-debilis TaxID=2754530 RepID=A0A1Y2FGJ1_PROLT|nr:mitochondrial carrier domain-containing protein [Protomyces lactucae-debilis]ORY83039.1 mitochondrial carrier domain-containing protein [Protomyces lactucae-debilis]
MSRDSRRPPSDTDFFPPTRRATDLRTSSSESAAAAADAHLNDAPPARQHYRYPQIGGTHRDYVIPQQNGMSDTAINAVAGACAGLVSSVATCPLDVVKTKLQAQHTPTFETPKVPTAGVAPPSQQLYRGIFASLRRIWFEEGIRGLYRGLGPVLLGYLPTWASYFTIYQHCRNVYGAGQPSAAVLPNVAAAMTAGAISTTVTNPIWVVKTRMMTQSPSHEHGLKYKSTLDAFRTMFREEGLSTFYKGLGPSYFGIAHVAVQFPLYEAMKEWFGAQGPDAKLSNILLSSSLSKMIASATTYPHEVLRTRLQNQKYRKNDPRNKYTGIWHAFKLIRREEGWRMFYSGMGTNFVRTVPASALTLMTFEVVSSTLKQNLGKHGVRDDWRDASGE